jgi:hypothetical protein
MRRCSFSLAVMAICLGLTTGCGTASRAGRFGWFAKFGKGSALADKLADSPFKRSKSTEASPASETSDTKTSTADDAELVATIDRELPNASPAERLALFKDLKELGPEKAALLLRTGRQMSRGNPDNGLVQTGGRRDGSTSLYGNDTTNSSQAQTGYDRKPAGLGNASPWDGRGRQDDRLDRSAFNGSPGGLASSPGSTNRFGHSAVQNLGTTGARIDPTRMPLGENDARPSQFGSRVQQTAGTSSGMGPRSLSPFPSGANTANPPPPGGLGGLTPPAATTDIDPNRRMGDRFETNDPLDIPSGGTAGTASNRDLQKLIATAEAEIGRGETATTPAEKQRLIEQHVHLRMLYLMAGQQDRALVAIPGVEPADQEYWQQTFWAYNNYFDVQNIPDESERASQTIAQLTSAVQRLREKAQLELRNVTFSHKISSFGNFEKFERDEFTPGQPVLVYAEVDNFSSEPSADGQYRTILKSTIEVYKAGPNGDLVEKFAFDPEEDLCRNRRHDYFHSYEFTIPQRIGLGPHVLKLIVEDQLSRKIATYSLNFTVR